MDDSGRWLAANRVNWDDRVVVHVTSEHYDVASWLDDESKVVPAVRFDLEELSSLRPGWSPAGLSLAHLQCHFGLETLSWARLGAVAIGYDFSGAAIREARILAERARLRARFVECELRDAPSLSADRFDLVYSSVGSVSWLPDLEEWATTVRALVKPGGLFYMRDGHPLLLCLEQESIDEGLVMRHDYFAGQTPIGSHHARTYAQSDVTLDHGDSYQWIHPLSEILQSLLDAGLRICRVREYPFAPWQELPGMARHPVEGEWTVSGGVRPPLSFSLVAQG